MTLSPVGSGRSSRTAAASFVPSPPNRPRWRNGSVGQRCRGPHAEAAVDERRRPSAAKSPSRSACRSADRRAASLACAVRFLVTLSNKAAMGDFEYDLTEDGASEPSGISERAPIAARPRCRSKIISPASSEQSLRKVKVGCPTCAGPGRSDAAARHRSASSARRCMPAGAVPVWRAGQRQDEHRRTADGPSQPIWIPRTITVTGEIIRLFDPANHEEVPLGQFGRSTARSVALRPPLGADSPAADRGRRRADDGAARSHEQPTTGILEAPCSSRATAARW